MSTTSEWQLDHDTAFGRDRWSVIIDGNPRCIIECFDDEGNGTSGAEPIARLVHAAPDLLAALQALVGQNGNLHSMEAMAMAHAAILKAEAE